MEKIYVIDRMIVIDGVIHSTMILEKAYKTLESAQTEIKKYIHKLIGKKGSLCDSDYFEHPNGKYFSTFDNKNDHYRWTITEVKICD